LRIIFDKMRIQILQTFKVSGCSFPNLCKGNHDNIIG
jgi:hypothetical protein